MPGSSASYERLAAQDSAFLFFESAETHMHLGGTAVFEPGPLATADGGIDIDRIRARIASRLHHIPRYRQRLAWIPVQNHPVWVDDDHFNLSYHVRHTSLPRPGDDEQLKRLTARIMSQQLDRTRPLWEAWIVEGLEGGRFALVTKTHHCMADGISAVDLITVLLSTERDTTIEPLVPWQPRPAPSRLQLSRDEFVPQQREAARDRAGPPPRRGLDLVVGERAQEHGDEIHGRDAVAHAVMRLRDQREAAAVEPLDDPRLPEGPCPVELLRHDPRREALQLLVVARARKARVPDVVVEVEVIVVHPDRIVLDRDPGEPLTVTGDLMQARRDTGPDALDVDPSVGGRERARLEDRRAPEMHVGLRALEEEERAVLSGERFVRGGHRVRLYPSVTGAATRAPGVAGEPARR